MDQLHWWVVAVVFPLYSDPRLAHSLLLQLKALDRDLATLSDQKDKAMKTQLQLYRRIESLCGRLDLKMPEFDDINEKVSHGRLGVCRCL